MLFDRKLTPLRVVFFAYSATPPRPLRHFTKQAIDFPQQLQQTRGLVVADEPRALRYLANISYYRLSGYWGSLLTSGTTLDDILHRYQFDK